MKIKSGINIKMLNTLYMIQGCGVQTNVNLLSGKDGNINYEGQNIWITL